MERNLTLLFLSFKLVGFILSWWDSLGKKLLMFGILANISQNFVGLLDLTESKSSETNLDQCSIVHNLIFNWLHCYHLWHMSFHHQISSFSELVVERKVVHLLKGHSDSLLGQTPLLHDVCKFTNSLLRVLKEVGPAWCFAHALLDRGVSEVVLIVDVVELNDGDTWLVIVLLKATEVSHQRVTQKQ